MLKFLGVVFLVLIVIFLAIKFKGVRIALIVSAIIFFLVSFIQSSPKIWNTLTGSKLKQQIYLLNSENEELQSQIASLQEELSNIKSSNEDLMAQVSELKENTENDVSDSQGSKTLKSTSGVTSESTSDAIAILDLIFAPDGNIYQADDGFNFYSDIDCKVAVNDVKLISEIWLQVQKADENGNFYKLYIMLSDKGYVYSKDKPHVEKIG